jgi:TRAP-type C4-dicarboxylate transport system permease small subunit
LPASPQGLEKMTRWFWRVFEGSVNAAAVILFSAMVGVTAAGVFFRYVLNAALPWAEEADRYLFIWLTFIGASITMRYKAHIAVDVLVRYFRPSLGEWFALFSEACVLGFLVFVFWASGPVIEITSQTRATATNIPISCVYLAAPVGCILIGIETLRLMVRTWKKRREERV